MAVDRSEIIGRLESTVATWTREVTQAHDKLSEQISDARAQLLILLGVMGGGNGSTRIAETDSEANRLRDLLAHRDDQLEAAESQSAQLSQTIMTLKSELSRMRGAESTGADEGVAKDISALRELGDSHRSLLESVRADIDALKSSVQGDGGATESFVRDRADGQITEDMGLLRELGATNASLLEGLRSDMTSLRESLLSEKDSKGDDEGTGTLEGAVSSMAAEVRLEMGSLREAIEGLAGDSERFVSSDAAVDVHTSAIREATQDLRDDIAALRMTLAEEGSRTRRPDSDLSAEVKTLQDHGRTIMSSLDEMRSDLSDFMTFANTDTGDVSKAEERLSELKDMLDVLREDSPDTLSHEVRTGSWEKDLQTEIDALKVEDVDAMSEIADMSGQLEELKQENARVKAEEGRLREKERGLLEEIERLRSGDGEAGSDESKEVSPDDALEGAEIQIGQLEDTIAGLERDVTRLRDEREGLVIQMGQLEVTVAGLDRELTVVQEGQVESDGSTEDGEKQDEEAGKRIEELEGRIAEFEGELASAQSSAKEREALLTEALREIEVLQAAIFQLRSTHGKAATEGLEVQVAELTNTVSQLQKKEVEHRGALHKAHRDAQQVRRKFEEEEQSSKERESRFDNVVDGMRRELVGYHDQITEAREESRGLVREMDGLRNLGAESKAALDEAQSRLGQLEGDLSEWQANAEQAKGEIDRLEGLLSEADGEEDEDVRAALIRAVGDLEKADREVGEMKVKVDTLMRANATIRVAPDGATADEGERILLAGYDADDERRMMGEILVNAGIITEQQLERALTAQRAHNHRRLGTILVDMGFTTEEIIARSLASQLKIPFMRLGEDVVEKSATDYIDGALATHHMCIPTRVADKRIVVAMANPLDSIAMQDLETKTGLIVEPVVATPSDITASIVLHYGTD